MSDTKSFHISDLLSITTEILLSREHIGGVYKILGHMTGDDLMTHQLPLACDAMQPELLIQHPWLKGLTPPADSTVDEKLAWVDEQARVHGEMHDVEGARRAWGDHDPMADFHNQWPDKPVVAVVLPEVSGG